MNQQTNEPAWLTGMLNKRPLEAMNVLCDLLATARASGRCSANDVLHKPQQHNVVGGVFKKLPSCGLRQTPDRIKPLAKEKHARLLYVWEVTEPVKLNRVYTQIRQMLVGADQFGNMELQL